MFQSGSLERVSRVFREGKTPGICFPFVKKVISLPIMNESGVFAADEVNQMLQATPPKLRREVGMCGNAANKKKIEKQKVACE